MEWEFDHSYPKIRVSLLDFEKVRVLLHVINRLPFDFESQGRDVLHAWLYEEEHISIKYEGLVVFESEDPTAPTLLDHFILALLW